jgi:RNA polymerase sigma-70 factor (sigma-E family)
MGASLARVRHHEACRPPRGTVESDEVSMKDMSVKAATDEGGSTASDLTVGGPAPPVEAPKVGFDEFFREAWPGAVRLAAFLTQDRGAAEEIAQDALTQMYADWGRAERPHAYRRTTLVNRCHNWRRHAGVHRSKLPLLVTPGITDLVVDGLADAVAALPFRQRAVVVLRYYGGLSEVEIAEALGCRPGTVKSLASRALARLQKEIAR